MATSWTEVTIPADKAVSSPFLLTPHGRILGIVPLGGWDEADIGVDIGRDSEDARTAWYPVLDAMTNGERAHIKGVVADSFHIICDFNHPFSDLNDEYVRLVSFRSGPLLSDSTPVRQTEERKLAICVRSYE